MRISLRLIVSLVIGTTLVAFSFTFFRVQSDKRILRRDLERRAAILAESLSEQAAPVLQQGSREDLQELLDRTSEREHLAGIAVYDSQGGRLAIANGLASRLPGVPQPVQEALASHATRSDFLGLGQTTLHIHVLPLPSGPAAVGALAIFQDASYIDARAAQSWRDSFLHVLVQALLLALISLLIIRISVMQPLARTTQWMRELRTGRGFRKPEPAEQDLLGPLVQEATHFARSLETARASAEEEARLRDTAESRWTAERLRAHVRTRLQDRPLCVVSNREPLMHVRRGKDIEGLVPASGLVTAIEPILRACHGTWVAHGSGDADRETVDERSRLRVPPEDPQYTLRRVWLDRKEEEGYYYGFSNEGLWPLCHIAHTRPIFREPDWEYYQAVNQKFAQAVVEEMGSAPEPAVLVQDYHFALLPRLLKESRPDARVAIFWHIPWPNPEAFGICPWQRELLDGLLGADLVGFHIQAHCNNFLETVDSALECRIDWERFAVNRRGHLTLVQPFPISVEFPESPAQGLPIGSMSLQREALLKALGIRATFLGVGVDRVDYTKGIIERFRGVERFLEKYPAYQKQFTFVQVGAPSRTSITRYHDLLEEVQAEARRINDRFKNGVWKPIVLMKRHHSHQEIEPFYQVADLCMVTSLHDGMNLVAKEFVVARGDDHGALILSQFTGACRELRDALIVNPHDTEQLADAIRLALEMDPQEQKARMQRMRSVVKEHNVYRWAGSLITELSKIGMEMPETSVTR
jgi:trehalose-6-phosphate synthase